jgi:hypothetical protein
MRNAPASSLAAPVAYFVSALDSLRLYAILSRVSREDLERDGKSGPSQDAPKRRIGAERGGIRRPAYNEEATGWNTKLLYLMIPTLKSGVIARVFGLFEENRCNCLTMNILHKNDRLFDGG